IASQSSEGSGLAVGTQAAPVCTGIHVEVLQFPLDKNAVQADVAEIGRWGIAHDNRSWHCIACQWVARHHDETVKTVRYVPRASKQSLHKRVVGLVQIEYAAGQVDILEPITKCLDQVAVAPTGGISQTVARTQRQLLGHVIADSHAVILEVEQRPHRSAATQVVVTEVKRGTIVRRPSADR